MNYEEIKKEVIKIISSLMQNNECESEIIEGIDLIDDFNLDSLTYISMIVEIETKFCITIPDDLLLMENFRNLEKIISIIKQQKKENKKNE